MRRKYSKVLHTFRKPPKRIFFFVCWICSHLWGLFSQFKAANNSVITFLMHVNLTDQRLRRIWSCTSTWTLSKQVIPLVFRHGVQTPFQAPSLPPPPPPPFLKKRKARSFASAFWTNSANYGEARLLFWIFKATAWKAGQCHFGCSSSKKKKKTEETSNM